MLNTETPHRAIIKRKYQFIYNVTLNINQSINQSSQNSLCVICQLFAEKELRGYISDYE